MPEQLAFNQRFGNSPTVDRHKGSILATAATVNCAGNHLLARATFSADQYRCIDIFNPLQQSIHLLHSCTGTNNIVIAITLRYLVLELTVFKKQAGFVGGVGNHSQQVFFLKGFGEIVISAAFDGIHCTGDAAKGGHQNHLCFRIDLQRLLQ